MHSQQNHVLVGITYNKESNIYGAGFLHWLDLEDFERQTQK